MKNLNKDDGNAVIVLGIMLIIATLTVGAMLLDLSKAFQLKSAYNDAARKATQSAIRHQNTEGYLTAEAIGEAIRAYEVDTRPAVINDGNYMSACKGQEGKVEIKVRAMKDGFVIGQTYSINRDRIRSTDTAEDIINKIPQLSNRSNKDKFERDHYLGVEIELHESTPNVILPNAALLIGDKTTANKTNIKCQLLGVKAGASQYIGKDNLHD